MNTKRPISRGRVSQGGLRTKKFSPTLILLAILIVVLAGALIVRYSRADVPAEFSNYKTEQPSSGVSPISFNSISIRFKPSAQVTIKDGKFFSPNYVMTAFNNAIFNVYKASSVQKQFGDIEADLAEKSATKNSGVVAPDLDLFYMINLNGSYDTVVMSDYLRQYYFVDSVAPAPGKMVSQVSKDYSNLQFYRLDKFSNKDTGITASGKKMIATSDYGMNTAATENLPGADGKNVTILNIDGGFDTNHEDISKFKANNSFINYINTSIGEKNLAEPVESGGVQHGTATVSITSADKNAYGVTGLAPAAKLLYANGNYINPQGKTVSGVARAIVAAIPRMKAGDVINISMGGEFTSNGKVYDYPIGAGGVGNPELAAIRTATLKGIYVIISAGNSHSNYDDTALYGNGYPTKAYNYDDPNDPGNYLIGAITPGPWCTENMPSDILALTGNGPAGSRIAFSTYGKRVGPSSWGFCVMSAGSELFTLSATDNSNYHDNYTLFFNGTSASAPLVSGVVASFSSAFQQKNGFTVKPKDLYPKLIATGKPQVTSGKALPGNIGPTVNAEKLFRDANLFPGQPVTPTPPTPPTPPAPPTPAPPKNPPTPPAPPAPPPPAPPKDKQPIINPIKIAPTVPIYSPEYTAPTSSETSTPSSSNSNTTNQNQASQNDQSSSQSSGTISSTSGTNNAKFTTLTPKEVVLSWQTDNTTTAKVLFGKGDKLNDSVSSSASKSHQVKLPTDKFISGQSYNYKIVSTEPNGKVVESQVQSFVYPGYTLKIEVKDSNKKAVVNAQVSIGDNKAFTDGNGVAELSNVPLGNQNVAIEYNKVKQIGQVEVKDAPNDIQQYSMTFTKSTKTDWFSIIMIIGLVISIGVVGFILIRKRSNSSNIPPAYI